MPLEQWEEYMRMTGVEGLEGQGMAVSILWLPVARRVIRTKWQV